MSVHVGDGVELIDTGRGRSLSMTEVALSCIGQYEGGVLENDGAHV